MGYKLTKLVYSKNIDIYTMFFEQETGEFHWEGLHMYSVYREYYKKHGDSKWMNYTGATQLGILTYIIFMISLINRIYECGVLTLNSVDIFLLCLSAMLLFVTFIINRNFKRENAYELESIIMQYKKSLLKNSRKDYKNEKNN